LELKSNTATGENASLAYAVLSEAADNAAKGDLSETRARLMLARLCEIFTGERLKLHPVRSWSEDWLTVEAVTKQATQNRYRTMTLPGCFVPPSKKGCCSPVLAVRWNLCRKTTL
jgi:hypothetical protein